MKVPAIGGHLWIAGLDDNGNLHPAAAIVDGKTWEGWPESVSDSDELPTTLDEIPAAWLPPGHKFPAMWQAYLFNGKRLTIQATGIERDAYNLPKVITTSLTPALLSPTIRDSSAGVYVSGFAVVGEVGVRLFRLMTPEEQHRVLPLLESALWQSETKAITEYAAASREAAGDVAGFIDDLRRSRRLRVVHAVTATLANDLDTFYVELEKDYEEPKECRLTTRFGATLIDNGTGSPTVTTTAAELVCEKFVSRMPLAIVERGDVGCWLAHDMLNEGFRFVLTRPGRWVTDKNDCSLK